MKRFISKILIFCMLALIMPNNSFAIEITPEFLAKEMLRLNKEARIPELKAAYYAFGNLIETKGKFENLDIGWLSFDKENDKLLIGCSGAVYCGYTLQDEGLKKLGYDLIGFGGVFDDELIELMQSLGDKKYKKIVIFGGVNDLNIRTMYEFVDIDLYYCEILNKMLAEAKQHLIDENGEVYYVKVKPMIYGIDSGDELFVYRYNNMAKEINDNIELFGYKSYEFPQDTSAEYTEHYVHFNNATVYEAMFNAIG